jgi:hypothetical protein
MAAIAIVQTFSVPVKAQRAAPGRQGRFPASETVIRICYELPDSKN